MSRICVFCASTHGNRPEYGEVTRAFGRRLVARGHSLVYGGGNVGLMGVVADAVLEAGGEVTGVIPHALMAREIGHGGVTRLHVVDSMHERKAAMTAAADAFIAMPGGFGTMDELFEAITWGQLGIHRKPIGLYNVAGYFDPILAWIDLAVKEGFVRPQHRQLLVVSDDPSLLIERLARHQPPVSSLHWNNDRAKS